MDDSAESREPLSISERSLVQIANAHTEDFFLSSLVDWASQGVTTTIAVLTNGMVVTGTLASSSELARAIDSEIPQPDEIEGAATTPRSPRARGQTKTHSSRAWTMGTRSYLPSSRRG